MANAEFTHTINVFIGVGTPVQLLCFENGITNHRKLKSKWKGICKLEYTDSTTGTKAKQSDDDYEEFAAICHSRTICRMSFRPGNKEPSRHYSVLM